jgi:hypothetical protein
LHVIINNRLYILSIEFRRNLERIQQGYFKQNEENKAKICVISFSLDFFVQDLILNKFSVMVLLYKS